MRMLLGPGHPAADGTDELTGQLTDEDLVRLYAAGRTPWLRVNMISTVDGAATGDSGTSGSINNPADKRVFETLRGIADAIVVGAGTARAEGYGPVDTPLVLVSRRAEVPEELRGAEPGAVWLATCATAHHLAEARDLLGPDHVLELGSDHVDLATLKATLAERGLVDLLSEGGPHLLRDLVDQGVADEVTVTTAPRLVAGDFPRIAQGPALDVPLSLRLLLEQDGTLLARWFL